MTYDVSTLFYIVTYQVVLKREQQKQIQRMTRKH